jgi:hypothetical protein
VWMRKPTVGNVSWRLLLRNLPAEISRNPRRVRWCRRRSHVLTGYLLSYSISKDPSTGVPKVWSVIFIKAIRRTRIIRIISKVNINT